MPDSTTFDENELDRCLGITYCDQGIRSIFEDGAKNLLERYSSNSTEAEAFAHEAMQFLAASTNSADELADRGKFKRFIGFFTGGNQKLRDFSNLHLREAQRATIQLLGKLSEQNVLLMDSIKLNQQAIQYLYKDIVCLKKYLIQMFERVEQRFILIEKELLDHRYRINLLEFSNDMYSWQQKISVAGNVKKPANSFSRLFEVTANAYEFIQSRLTSIANDDPGNKYRWNSGVFLNYNSALRNLGFSKLTSNGWDDEKTTIRNLVKKLSDEYKIGMLGRDYSPINLEYPIPLIMGSTLIGKIFWYCNYALQHNIKVEEIWKTLQSVHSIDLDKQISWIEIGEELLYQMKLMNDPSYIRSSMQGTVQDISREYFLNAPELQVSRFSCDNRVNESVLDWTKIVTGFKYELVRGIHSIDLYIQFIETHESRRYYRIIILFINPLTSFENIISFGKQNDLEVTYKPNDQIIEIGVEIIPDWYNWQTQQKEIALRIASLIDALDQWRNGMGSRYERARLLVANYENIIERFSENLLNEASRTAPHLRDPLFVMLQDLKNELNSSKERHQI